MIDIINHISHLSANENLFALEDGRVIVGSHRPIHPLDVVAGGVAVAGWYIFRVLSIHHSQTECERKPVDL